MSTTEVTTLMAFVATYGSKADAESDFKHLAAIEHDFDIVDGYDCAVISKNDDGKVRIDKTHETPTRAGAVFGGGLGLAAGLVAALFPAVALTGGLVLGATAGGAALGAVTGHVEAGFSRSDLKDLGELLDAGQAALIYIGARETEVRARELMAGADQITTKPISTDRKAAVEDAAKAAKEADVDVRDGKTATEADAKESASKS